MKVLKYTHNIAFLQLYLENHETYGENLLDVNCVSCFSELLFGTFLCPMNVSEITYRNAYLCSCEVKHFHLNEN